jgi:Rrf2 family iron-sulfur cluster assembly transcriptional regulator
MMLGTKGRYAVMAMVDLARHSHGKPVCLADIAGRQGITLPYLEQIFSKLRRAGIVNAVKGPGGGYVLARAAAEIPVFDMVRAVEESLKITRCAQHQSGCMSDKARCLTHDLWEGLETQIQDYLSSVSLEDVCARRVAVSRSTAALKPLAQAGAL